MPLILYSVQSLQGNQESIKGLINANSNTFFVCQNASIEIFMAKKILLSTWQATAHELCALHQTDGWNFITRGAQCLTFDLPPSLGWDWHVFWQPVWQKSAQGHLGVIRAQSVLHLAVWYSSHCSIKRRAAIKVSSQQNYDTSLAFDHDVWTAPS